MRRTRHDLTALNWLIRQNADPHPDLNGSDLYVCWAEELPSAEGWGSTPDDAMKAAKRRATEILGTLTEEQQEDIFGDWEVISMRVRARTKERVCERADRAGMTLTRYMLTSALSSELVDASVPPRANWEMDRDHIARIVEEVVSNLFRKQAHMAAAKTPSDLRLGAGTGE